ncbi:MAG: N-acetylneuraminate synthase family protein [Candidatus Pacebacteria bacterium]|nr:N-acetylneuraminate synthase family protein [Candidatus Paceibacterota bacterium]
MKHKGTKKTIKLGNKLIGWGQPCFIVAEAGANHDGDFEKAKMLIDAAAAVNADSIKFQHYLADKLASREAKRYWVVRGDEPGFQFDPNNYKDDQVDTFKKIDGIPRHRDSELFDYADKKGLLMFSTPFDFESVDHLDSLGIQMYKIASGDLTYHQLLDYVARKGKPVVLSTGAADMDEIRAAVDVIKKAGNNQIILLHCTLAYTTPLENANLLMIRNLQEEFPDELIGFSDHTPGIEADIAAALLGAVMIEKHFTHTPGAAVGENRVGDSPDHDIGIGSAAFEEKIKRIREHEGKNLSVRLGLDFEKALEMISELGIEKTLGSHQIKQVDSKVELKARLQARRSVVTEVPLKKGETLTQKFINAGNLSFKRPGTGIPPYEICKLAGKKLNRDLSADAVLKWEYFK